MCIIFQQNFFIHAVQQISQGRFNWHRRGFDCLHGSNTPLDAGPRISFSGRSIYSVGISFDCRQSQEESVKPVARKSGSLHES